MLRMSSKIETPVIFTLAGADQNPERSLPQTPSGSFLALPLMTLQFEQHPLNTSKESDRRATTSDHQMRKDDETTKRKAISFSTGSKQLKEAHKHKSSVSSDFSLDYYQQLTFHIPKPDPESPWFSLWLANAIMLVAGLQFSIYFTSMWPFLMQLDNTVTLDFFGWVIASYSVGQAVASPIFGAWNQKTKGTAGPVMAGMAMNILGNLTYALLPTFSSNQKWIMLAARFVVGFGSGIAGVLRAYISTASTTKDRSRAVALGTASFVTGIAVGPAVQTAFQPIGQVGASLGSVKLNMFTTPSYFVIFLSLVAILMLKFCFVEQYAGIITEKEKAADPFTVLPKFDLLPALVCIYVWFLLQSVSTNNEVIATPYTMAMYDWSDDQAVFYNGIIAFASATVNVSIYLCHAFTRIGKIDPRRLMICGLSFFLLFFLLTIPWPFYNGPLDYKLADMLPGQYIPKNASSTAATSVGGDHHDSVGCELSYKWCASTTRVPIILYIFAYTCILGVAYPNVASPLGTLFSQVLGPRKQGNMQGIFMFTGSLARCVAPIFVTTLFKWWGPMIPWLAEAILLFTGIVMIVIFYKRLVPLRTLPALKSGDLAKYKSGVVYRM